MRIFKFYSFLIFLIAIHLSCQQSYEELQSSICDKNDVISEKLVSVEEAQSLLERSENFIPVEVSSAGEYSRGHISGAINVWRPDFRSKTFTTYGGMICSENELIVFLQKLGISTKDTLLVYDNKGASDAMRLGWVFDFYGFKNYKVINGGKSSWIQNNYTLETIINTPVHNEEYYFDSKPESNLLATMNDVLSALNDENALIVDTREPYEYLGQPFIAQNEVLSYKAGAYERGCIPGAVHLNWSELSDLATDHRIKCTKDLIYNLEKKGITRDKNIIVYCQSGSRSSHTAFVLREILGYPSVKNYDGSWIEWSYYHKNGESVAILKHTDDKQFDELKQQLIQDLNMKDE